MQQVLDTSCYCMTGSRSDSLVPGNSWLTAWLWWVSMQQVLVHSWHCMTNNQKQIRFLGACKQLVNSLAVVGFHATGPSPQQRLYQCMTGKQQHRSPGTCKLPQQNLHIQKCIRRYCRDLASIFFSPMNCVVYSFPSDLCHNRVI